MNPKFAGNFIEVQAQLAGKNYECLTCITIGQAGKLTHSASKSCLLLAPDENEIDAAPGGVLTF